MPIVRLENLLKSGASSRLDKIIQTAKDTEALTLTLRAVLDAEAGAALVSAAVREDELTVLCNSSAWAARLRFEADRLLAAAREHGYVASHCRVRVAR